MKILCGLIVSGFLLALPGCLLPVWGYHISSDFGMAGNYFLVLGVGIAAGGGLAQRLARRNSLARLLTGGCSVAMISVLMLAFAAPPARLWYQMLALVISGLAAGLINTAVLEGVASSYEANPATTTFAAGIFFGAGSIMAPVLLSQALGEGSARRMLALAVLIPAAAVVWFARIEIPRKGAPAVSVEQAVRDLRSGLAILFALLLFFQFANEWSIAGWLPVFLIDRLGISPATAVSLLAAYWLALIVGRIAACRILPLVRHSRMLAASAACALFGCMAMLASGSRFGVIVGLLLTGAGFSAIYPLAAERIASRFSYYHPGYFNGIFTFALMGGILAPFVLGHIAGVSGLEVIPLSVMAGSFAVFGLILLISLGRKVSGH